MAFSTFTGPVRSGTVKNTTGTTLGTIDNTGVVSLVQSASLALATKVVAVLPAGSQILDILIDVTTTFTTSSTLAVGDCTTADAYVTAITTPAAGRQAITFSGATSPADIGKLMKALMPAVQGKADGRRVQDVVKTILK